MTAAARFPLRSDPAKSQFLRPRAQGRIWFSHQLLSMGKGPADTSERQRLSMRRLSWRAGVGQQAT